MYLYLANCTTLAALLVRMNRDKWICRACGDCCSVNLDCSAVITMMLLFYQQMTMRRFPQLRNFSPLSAAPLRGHIYSLRRRVVGKVLKDIFLRDPWAIGLCICAVRQFLLSKCEKLTYPFAWLKRTSNGHNSNSMLLVKSLQECQNN